MDGQPHAPQSTGRAALAGWDATVRFNLISRRGPFGETVDLPLEANEYDMGLGGESVGGPISLCYARVNY